MDTWSRDRIALVGDAAFCVSLMAGQGLALAMIAAYVLAGELAQAGERHHQAFANYEAQLRAQAVSCPAVASCPDSMRTARSRSGWPLSSAA
jgi:2-polyprenyl-6-methoxyphenol hydroxylase-like FAD-dependent oxidoreductase